ncbi:MAG: ribonuclease J [Candidatus Sumerlaeia bacterium]|nr:ribonuclease J [Candidatus Sumerlaeia bacterium]
MTQPLLATLPNRPGALRAIPLGGFGEFGMNCMLIEYGGEFLMIDCGQMMPGEELPGVDSVIPDFRFIEERADALKGIWITHAHEDHVGALAYLLPKLSPKIPVYAGEFTAALLREKLREDGIEPRFTVYEGRRRYRIGASFEVEPVAVTHSTMDTFAAVVRTPAGVIVHSADYKIDPSPPDGVAFDHYAFARYAEEGGDGVLALFNDSTNADRRGSCPSEIEVVPRLRQLIREAEGMVILSCFSSALHRIQTVMNIAADAGRTVFAAGLNMERVIRVASELEYLDIRCRYEADLRALETVPRHKRLVLTTGSQGEAMSALSRISLGTHKFVKAQPGDTAILSARMIPGNERAIYTMLNNLCKCGIHVHDERSTPGIHVSGHAYRDDLKTLINLTNPKYLVPMHGEFRQLQTHRQIGLELGFEPQEVLMLETGDCLEFMNGAARVIGKVPHGRVLVDGKGIGDVGEVVLRDRRTLAQDGTVFVTLAIDTETGEVLSGPDIVSRGFIHEDENEALLAEARQVVLDAIQSENPGNLEDLSVVQAAVKKALRKLFKQRTERFPMILPVVLEV